MYEIHRCLGGCGKVVTWQFALCRECEDQYGSSPFDWPEWLRFLWADTQRERRKAKRVNQFEVPIDDVVQSENRKVVRRPGAQ